MDYKDAKMQELKAEIARLTWALRKCQLALRGALVLADEEDMFYERIEDALIALDETLEDEA